MKRSTQIINKLNLEISLIINLNIGICQNDVSYKIIYIVFRNQLSGNVVFVYIFP